MPAALSVPGDVLAGAVAGGKPPLRATITTMASSVALYWAGMALNDYADATVDAVERPDRPVPSGRVPRRTALTVAAGLTAAGLGLATLSGGRRALATAVPLTALIWAYDLNLKSTPAGPAAMAGARTLNVLSGAAPGHRTAALPAALLTGAHTYTVTALSRHEVTGAPRELAAGTLAGSAAIAGAVALLPGVRKRGGDEAAQDRAGWIGAVSGRHGQSAPLAARTRPAPSRAARIGAVAGAAGYLAAYGSAQARALREPSARNVQGAVGNGILSLLPLQAALTAGAGGPVRAAILAAAHPLARRLARKVSPT